MIERIFRASRVGSWYFGPSLLRASLRFRFDPGYRFSDDGFRLVVRIEEKEE